MDILPHDDDPDAKKRVRLTLTDSDPLQDPSGDVEVFGTVYERNINPNLPPSSAPVSEVVHFYSDGTVTTLTYFDEVTSIETEPAGLGVDGTLEAEFWDGHEQEMSVGVEIVDVTDPTECTEGWVVYFNGQEAQPDWDSTTARCTAGLIPGAIKQNGVLVHNPAYRGLYFGVDTDEDEEDSFFDFNNVTGHTSSGSTWEQWIQTLPYGGYFFDVGTVNDPLLRPIVIELERQSDLQIVDAARVMMTISVSPWGERRLQAMLPGTENPGAIAQLSEHGLDRLEQTHAVTLPYPIVPAGTQPRLSQSAIALPEHMSPRIKVDLADLPDADLDYWTKDNPADTPNEGEFAGYLAYQASLSTARGLYATYQIAIKSCKSTPNPPACEAAVKATHCVDSNPKESNFRIRIEGVNTYFDPARTDDALVIGDVTGMDLSFGSSKAILADFTLEDIQGWLQASIDPANIFIEWDKAITDPCVIKPPDVPLSDFVVGSDDYEDWLTCRDLSFTSGPGSLADPVEFAVVQNGEFIDTPYGQNSPEVSLQSVGADSGIGICEQEWLSTLIEDEIFAWEDDVADAIEVELITSPGEDEALNRLVSPYELGVTRVDNPPPGTPPYDVHPIATYELSARIGKTAPDPHGVKADSVAGLYIPYLTQSTPVNAVPFLTWFCPRLGGQGCDGLLSEHESMLEGGLDPDGDPFDVALSYTTAHINQALWAQARRPDRLGSPNFPVQLEIDDDVVLDFAAELGFQDVVDALSAIGSRFGIRHHQEGAPFTVITDGNPPRFLYMTPNLVVEVLSLADDGTENVVAKFLVDVIDRELQLSFSEGGAPYLDAQWGELAVLSMTSTFLPECNDTIDPGSCSDHLRAVVGGLLRPSVEASLLDMIETAPALQLFDSGQESGKPRYLKNVRTFLLNQSVALVADLCNPEAEGDCP